jgi:hypothetical protein
VHALASVLFVIAVVLAALLARRTFRAVRAFRALERDSLVPADANLVYRRAIACPKHRTADALRGEVHVQGAQWR